jgi:hypothetical protein
VILYRRPWGIAAVEFFVRMIGNVPVTAGTVRKHTHEADGKGVGTFGKGLGGRAPRGSVAAGGRGPAERTESTRAAAPDSDFWNSMARKVSWKTPRKATCRTYRG